MGFYNEERWRDNVSMFVAKSATGITTPEVDSFLLSKITYGEGTYGTKVYGFTMDLHYEVDRNSTPNKAPNFYA